ncbi:hypothetical protein NXS19_005459 [Fusarium pseudograminearum]|nr:hypothetical protein NXS19_005459 [Fusarium pseudograminearum]
MASGVSSSLQSQIILGNSNDQNQTDKLPTYTGASTGIFMSPIPIDHLLIDDGVADFKNQGRTENEA